MRTWYQSRMIWNSKLINNCFNPSAQRLMVKTSSKSDLPWSAIFSVIVCYMLCLGSVISVGVTKGNLIGLSWPSLLQMKQDRPIFIQKLYALIKIKFLSCQKATHLRTKSLSKLLWLHSQVMCIISPQLSVLVSRGSLVAKLHHSEIPGYFFRYKSMEKWCYCTQIICEKFNNCRSAYIPIYVWKKPIPASWFLGIPKTPVKPIELLPEVCSNEHFFHLFLALFDIFT